MAKQITLDHIPPKHGLLDFLNEGITPHHVCANIIRAINSATEKSQVVKYLNEGDEWKALNAETIYIVKRGASICVLRGDPKALPETGARILAAHTDSPGIRLKPNFDITRNGYPQLSVESYGGLLLSTWLDRPLALAGQLIVSRNATSKTKNSNKATPVTSEKTRLEGHLVDTRDAIATIPNLAIHLSRDVNTKGLIVNKQKHLTPLTGMAIQKQTSSNSDKEKKPAETILNHLLKLVDKNINTPILGHELWLYDNTPAQYIGVDRDLIQSARLDNLASCWSALNAFLTAVKQSTLPIALMLFNHEECGSRSDHGAMSPFLEECLQRWATTKTVQSKESVIRTKRNSLLISADMTHALHPNYPEAHEPTHQPVLGGGIAIKHNYNQSYATEALGSAILADIATRNDIATQCFVSRSDKRCGTTIGPISAAVTGIRTVDVGAPMLGMHSCKETAAVSDITHSIPLFTHFLSRT